MIERRRFLTSATAAAAVLAAPPLIRRANAQSVLDIAAVYSLSGTFANVGSALNDGSKWAVEAYGSAGGNKLNYVLLDDRGDAGEAVRKVQEVMTQHGIKHVVGCTNSAIGLAVQKEVHARGGIYVNEAGADEITGKDCNRSSFRWPVACYSAVNSTVRPLIDKFPQAKRWYTITGQYVFGDSLLSNCKQVFQEKGIQHVGNSYHSLSDREYSGYIATALSAAPDVLAVCNFGNQTVDVIRQAVSYGMKRNTKILAVWSTGLDQYQALGPENCDGVYFGCNFWHGVDSPGGRRVAEIVKQKTGDVPNYLHACGYAVAQVLIEGINKAGSTDVPKIIGALEGLSYEGPTGTETVRPQDHQVLKDYYLMLGKAKGAMKDKNDFADVVAATKAFLPPDKTGCTMG
ncbi:ABC transporter substrate-binding protein [Chelatococcus reniformis]|uniref:Substrate-binding protein n=1 Tax=Chelatococcus reniformis TaxID=1494448 RepID=A0A916TWW5_9HYPH|nr:ABC transporter substrate-binding protein [Chelatococcus reniformis]GGC46096.1 substrate-binding protein [Chelatococcus reniformis]